MHKFDCECGKHKFSATHLAECGSSGFGPWYCNNPECGISVNGSVKDGILSYVFNREDRKVVTWDLLRLDVDTPTPIHIVVDGFQLIHNGGAFDPLGNAYWYNEHTCPWNYLGAVVVEGDDTDPHGIFTLVDSVPVRKLYEIARELGYDGENDTGNVKHFLAEDAGRLKAVFPKIDTGVKT